MHTTATAAPTIIHIWFFLLVAEGSLLTEAMEFGVVLMSEIMGPKLAKASPFPSPEEMSKFRGSFSVTKALKFLTNSTKSDPSCLFSNTEIPGSNNPLCVNIKHMPINVLPIGVCDCWFCKLEAHGVIPVLEPQSKISQRRSRDSCSQIWLQSLTCLWSVVNNYIYLYIYIWPGLFLSGETLTWLTDQF